MRLKFSLQVKLNQLLFIPPDSKLDSKTPIIQIFAECKEESKESLMGIIKSSFNILFDSYFSSFRHFCSPCNLHFLHFSLWVVDWGLRVEGCGMSAVQLRSLVGLYEDGMFADQEVAHLMLEWRQSRRRERWAINGEYRPYIRR